MGVDDYTGGNRINVKQIYDISQAREHYARHILLNIDDQRLQNGYINELKTILQPFKQGFCPVILNYQRLDASTELVLGEEWKVHPTDELLHRLQEFNGKQHVCVVYN